MQELKGALVALEQLTVKLSGSVDEKDGYYAELEAQKVRAYLHVVRKGPKLGRDHNASRDPPPQINARRPLPSTLP